MMTRTFRSALVCAVALLAAAAALAQDIALKAGEKADVGPVYWIADCKSILKEFLGAEVLVGPDSVKASLRPEQVPARRQGCADKVNGAMLELSAAPTAAAFEGTVRVRVRYATADGEKQSTHAVKLLVVPAAAK